MKIERRDSRLAISQESGEFEGYIAVWETIDSYNSRFERGSFAKTINERSAKVKVLYNHESLIGRSLELREDDHGVFARGRINLDIQLGRDVYALMRSGDLDGLSFAFQVYQDGYDSDRVRVIKEVRLLEFGPVDFPANESATITDVRAEKISNLCLRSQEFNDYYLNMIRQSEWDSMFAALVMSANDIMFNGEDVDQKIDSLMGAFSERFKSWMMDGMPGNEEARNAILEISASGGIADIVRRSRLTEMDIASIIAGKFVDADFSAVGESCVRLNNSNKVAGLPPPEPNGADHSSRIKSIKDIWHNTL